MYSNESKGMKWPHVLAYRTDWVDCDTAGFPVTDPNAVNAAAGPNVPDIYPEYLTDPKILVCPSDAEMSVDDLINPITGQNELGIPCDDAERGMRIIDTSYAYFGWVMDQCEETNNQSDYSGYTGPNQFILMLVGLLGASDQVAASDADMPVEAPDGNAGGSTIYRLREGIERFMITDINNPAAGAKAQSTVFVMNDLVATATRGFNHVPGGCNVLYMDGHVEFVKYPGVAPVNMGCANIVTAVGFS
jgi:prepilin-type processing-associated H-X9-DG protein